MARTEPPAGAPSGPPAAGTIETTEPVRWLTPAEREAWLGINAVLLKLPALLDAQLQRDVDLTYFEYMVLAMLSEQPDRRLRMGRLAVLTSGSLSRLSHVVKRLELQGLVAREPDALDRRSTNAQLTDAGHDKVVDAAPQHVAAVRRLVMDALEPADIAALTQATERILTRIDPDGSARPPRPDPPAGPAPA